MYSTAYKRLTFEEWVISDKNNINTAQINYEFLAGIKAYFPVVQIYNPLSTHFCEKLTNQVQILCMWNFKVLYSLQIYNCWLKQHFIHDAQVC